MGRLKRLALWGCAALMAVTAVAVGEADPAWSTSPTDTADAPGGEAAAGGGAVDVSAAPLGRVWGAAEATGLRPAGRFVAGRSMVVLASSHCQHGQWSNGRCRACPVGQVWITGTGCVVATDPRQCSSGNTWLEPHGCRPTDCSYGRTSAGFCRSAPSCRSGDHPTVSHWHPTGNGHRTCQVHTTTKTCGTWWPGPGHSFPAIGHIGGSPHGVALASHRERPPHLPGPHHHPDVRNLVARGRSLDPAVGHMPVGLSGRQNPVAVGLRDEVCAR